MTEVEKMLLGFKKAAEYIDLYRKDLINISLSNVGLKISILDTYGNHTLATTRYISYGGLQCYKGDIFSLIRREIDEALHTVRRAKT